MFRSSKYGLHLRLATVGLLSACNSGTEPEPAGPAAQLLAVSDTIIAARVGTSFPDSLVIRVVDADSRGVPGHQVAWSAPYGYVNLDPTLSLTDRQGHARSSLRFGTISGEYIVRAQALTTDGPRSVQFRAIVDAGATATVQVQPGDPFLGLGDSIRLTAIRKDEYGNPITNRPVTWSSSNPAVVTVDPQTGMLRGIAVGSADVAATTEGRSAAVRVTVARTSGGEDTFDTNSLSAYTQYADASATWSISGGVLTATGGRHSVLIRNDVVMRNGWVEAQMDRADEGGLVLRFQNEQNYYLLAAYDDGSLLGSRNLEIYRRTNGQWIILSSNDIVWPRGTEKMLRFEANGSTLRAFVDGVLVTTVTDGTIQHTGPVGMRYSDVSESPGFDVARYLAFRWNGIE